MNGWFWSSLPVKRAKKTPKPSYWYLQASSKPKHCKCAKYRNTPLDTDFQYTIWLCQFSHAEPPCKRSRTTNDRLGNFLLIQLCTQKRTHTYTEHLPPEFWDKIRRKLWLEGSTCPRQRALLKECALLLNQAQHMLQCQTLSNVWIRACPELELVLSEIPLASEWKLPGTETSCNRLCRSEAL